MPVELKEALILVVVIIMVMPQAWKESNSWWFTIIKFWFGIIPFMIGAAGIFVFFVGPIYALFGLVNPEYLPITLLYVYLGILDRIIDKYNHILKTL